MTGWCCVYVSDPGSLEVARLAVELRCAPTEALGWLVRLWAWALVQAPDGATERWGDALGAAVGWHGDSAAFRRALVASGAVTEAGEIVGWGDRYKLRRQAERQARLRGKARDATVASPSADSDALQDRTQQDITGQEKERDTSAERSPSPALTLEPAPGRAPRARRPRPAPEGPHEADPADTESEIVAEVPSTQGPVRVRRALVEALRATAPGVDVDLEVRRAAEWSAGNPTRRKTPAGVRRFLAAWMARQQDRGGGGGPGMGQAPRGPYSQRPQTQAERIAELEAREAAGTMGPGEAGELTRWRLRHLGGLELVAGGVR